MSMIASLYTEYHCCWQTRTLYHFLLRDSRWKSSHRENQGISWCSGENWQRGVLQDYKSFIALHCHVKFCCHYLQAGVSIKIEVASGLDRVTDCINEGPLVPFSSGGGVGGGLSAFRPPKFWNFKAPKMRFSVFWRLNLRTKERVFHSRKCSFQFISHTINSYEQWTTMMKTKLRTFGRKQILHKPIRNFWKNDWNIAFTLLKHNVKPVGLSEIIIPFSFRLWNIFCLYRYSN